MRVPREVTASLAAALPAGRAVRVLARGRAGDRWVLGLPGLLAWQEGDAWGTIGWHRILRGGWQAEAARLAWIEYDGTRGELGLTDPGALPDLFRERVTASILVRRDVAVEGTRHGVTVVGRRVLDSEPPEIQWHASLNRGTRWTDPGAREAAEQVLAELQADFAS